MIVCHCVGASEATIRRAIADGAASLQDVARRTGAGRCCTPCQAAICAMLDERAPADVARDPAPALDACAGI